MSRYINFLSILFGAALSGCTTVIVGGICAAEYPFEKKPTFTGYSYDVHISYIKNGISFEKNTSMLCTYKKKSCNAANGIYDEWESYFIDGERNYIIANISNSESIVISKPDCKTSAEKVENEKTYGSSKNGYSAASLLSVNDRSWQQQLLLEKELKNIYGIENLKVVYKKQP